MSQNGWNIRGNVVRYSRCWESLGEVKYKAQDEDEDDNEGASLAVGLGVW